MENKRESFLARLLKGAVIGIAAILPGASGGVLAVAMGVYKPVLDAVTSLFRHFKRNIIFLLPLGIGGLVGLFGTSRAVEFLMTNYRLYVMWALIGMVMGGLPSLIKEANAHGFKARYLIGAVIGAAVIGGTALLQLVMTGNEPLPLNGLTAALCGALIGLGTVIPGISTSFIMMYLGLYEPFLSAFNTFDLGILACAGLGMVAVIVALIALVKKLFDTKYGYAYYGALGLLLTSVGLIFPGFGKTLVENLINAALFIACFIGTFFLCKLPDPGLPDISALKAEKEEKTVENAKDIDGGNDD